MTPPTIPQQQEFIDALEHELRAGSGFARIHAAEALVEHGYGFKASEQLQADADTTVPGYRVGVWRVLARCAKDEREREQFVERIRNVMLDSAAPDRLGAAESLDKIGRVNRADRPAIEQWLRSADDATAAFPLWFLVLSGDANDTNHGNHSSERARDEARLARLLESNDAMARLRAGFALGRLARIPAEFIEELNRRVREEPADSRARVYLLAASLLHAPRGSAAATEFRKELLSIIESGDAKDQLEAATVIGMRGSPEDLPALLRLLKSRDADARIGAASAALYLAQ